MLNRYQVVSQLIADLRRHRMQCHRLKNNPAILPSPHVKMSIPRQGAYKMVESRIMLSVMARTEHGPERIIQSPNWPRWTINQNNMSCVRLWLVLLV